MIYLYIKEHAITGLKYFGMTKKKNPFKYNGSGLHWVRHFNKHGKQYIKTIDVFGFDNQETATEFALAFSKRHDIVESSIWANKIAENALTGKPCGTKSSNETKQKLSKLHKGSVRPPRSEEYRRKLSQCQIGKKRDKFVGDKIRQAAIGRRLFINEFGSRRYFKPGFEEPGYVIKNNA